MKPLRILKKGLAKLRHQVQSWKTRLESELKACLPISDADQEWLDNDGNLIDEERVVDALDHASDYERGLERLNSYDELVVLCRSQHLHERRMQHWHNRLRFLIGITQMGRTKQRL